MVNFLSVSRWYFSLMWFANLQPQGVQSLECYRCNEKEQTFPDVCLTTRRDTKQICEKATTCVIGTGVRKVPGKILPTYSPVMGRGCSVPKDVEGDAKIFRTMAKGQKMVCQEVTRPMSYGPRGLPLVDRRCFCVTDYCNALGWDKLMEQPVLSVNYAESDTPKPAPGNFSLAAIDGVIKVNLVSLTVTDPPIRDPEKAPTTVAVTAKVYDDKDDAIPGNDDAALAADDNGHAQDTTVSTMTLSTSYSNASDPSNNATGEGRGSGTSSSGSNAGLIAGIAAGVVTLAAVAGGLWYWFKIRKRKKSTSSAASGDSDNSADTGDSAGGEEE
ncbi:uncharacterized protein LOC129582778 isoform X2 [Paramacrobiotus metropolitanus]|uniref:uncharacterized protein LOC129582778 isoform X2 n=1 Tax=Paramacrobiotus metropolitanus TaxID=2943436 RepID=UPI0024465B5B|nr:uncharacterized protein LOC129582778 isoform X2 [Paramacrobiotus metropolitanus]